MKKKETDFLKEYKILCLKHKFELNGCGCCGSPFLSELDGERLKNKTIKLSGSKKDVSTPLYMTMEFFDKKGYFFSKNFA